MGCCGGHGCSVAIVGSSTFQAFDTYRALELRSAELEELIDAGEGDVEAYETELQEVNDTMEKLEDEMMHSDSD